MYAYSLVGRSADTVVEMPYHVFQSCLAAGTVRKATDAEIVAAGILIAVEAPPLTADSAFPAGYNAKPTDFGGYDLFEPGGIRLNEEPYPNLAAARSAAIAAVDMHVAPFVPVEEALSQEMIDSQLALRPERTFTLADYEARVNPAGGFDVVEPGGIIISEAPVASHEEARAIASEHLRIMLEQGEGPGPEGEAGDGLDREVDVPADWESLHHMKIRALARVIDGGEEPASLDAAKASIREYIRVRDA